MLQVFHKILALILAFVVLFSTFSFSVDKHVCMGEVTDVTYFFDVESCGMIMEEEDCVSDNFSGDEIHKDKCCSNIHELIPGNQNEQQAIHSMELEQARFVLAYSYIYLNLFEEDKKTIHYNCYDPPLIDENILVRHQTFLI